MSDPTVFWTVLITIMLILAVGAVLPSLLVLSAGWRKPRHQAAHRRPRRQSIRKMPAPLREVMDSQIKAGVHYREIAATLTRAGYPINNASICRYARRELGVARRKPLTNLAEQPYESVTDCPDHQPRVGWFTGPGSDPATASSRPWRI